MNTENNNTTSDQKSAEKAAKNAELIVVIPKLLINSYSNPVNKERVSGPILTPLVAKIVHSCMAYMAPRGSVETDTRLLQPIPYGCIVDDDNRVLTYRRTSHGGETRLENKYSIGFGGHVNITDVRMYLSKMNIDEDGLIEPVQDTLLNGPLAECVRRELKEELGLEKCYARIDIDEAIYDPSEDVSAVHIGVPYIIHLEDVSEIKKNENTIDELEWHTIDELNTPEWQNKLEGWSNILVGRLKTYMEERKEEDSGKDASEDNTN